MPSRKSRSPWLFCMAVCGIGCSHMRIPSYPTVKCRLSPNMISGREQMSLWSREVRLISWGTCSWQLHGPRCQKCPTVPSKKAKLNLQRYVIFLFWWYHSVRICQIPWIAVKKLIKLIQWVVVHVLSTQVWQKRAVGTLSRQTPPRL